MQFGAQLHENCRAFVSRNSAQRDKTAAEQLVREIFCCFSSDSLCINAYLYERQMTPVPININWNIYISVHFVGICRLIDIYWKIDFNCLILLQSNRQNNYCHQLQKSVSRISESSSVDSLASVLQTSISFNSDPQNLEWFHDSVGREEAVSLLCNGGLKEGCVLILHSGHIRRTLLLGFLTRAPHFLSGCDGEGGRYRDGSPIFHPSLRQ